MPTVKTQFHTFKKIFKMKIFVLFLLLAVSFSCKINSNQVQNNDNPKPIDHATITDAEAKELSNIYKQIIDLANSEKCDGNLSTWKVIGIGSKPCGGPTGYIAYSPKIDAQSLINLVELYNEKGRDLNKKYNLKSDCMLVEPPMGLSCSNGKVIFKSTKPMM